MSLTVYLDTSVYNRPFDDQKQPRIWLEALAFSVILQMIENEDIQFINSSILEFEINRNPNDYRRNWISQVIQKANQYVYATEHIRNRANELSAYNIKPLDALHIATAESVKCDYFVTCDDRLIKRYNKIDTMDLIVCNPTDFIRMNSGV